MKTFKITYIFDKTVLCIICGNCGSEDKKIFKEEQSIEILTILGLIRIYNYLESMEEKTQALTLA